MVTSLSEWKAKAETKLRKQKLRRRQIRHLQTRVTGLESGVELQDLKKQLGQSKKQLARSAKDAEEHQKTTSEKAEEIGRLEQVAQDARDALDAKRKRANKETNKLGRNFVREKRKAVEKVVIQAKEDARKTAGEHERHVKMAVEQAVERAVEDVRRASQAQLNDERLSFQEAQEKATKTKDDLLNQIADMKAQAERFAEEKSDGAREGVRQTLQKQLDDERLSSRQVQEEASRNAKELAVLITETNDANNLLWEVGSHGIANGSVEHAVLCGLNKAKLALYKVKWELRKPHGAPSKRRLLEMIEGATVEEQVMCRINDNTHLVRQAKVANMRLEKLHRLLDTDGSVDIEAILEVLHTKNPFEREMRKPRGLKRPMQPGPGMPSINPSTSGQTENVVESSQQTAQSPVKAQSPLPGLLGNNGASTSPSTLPNTAIAPDALPKENKAHAADTEPAAKAQPPLPSLLGDHENSLSPSLRPKKNIRSRGRVLAHKALAENQHAISPDSTQVQQSRSQQQVADDQQDALHDQPVNPPEGWTMEMTSAVNDLFLNGLGSPDQIADFLKRDNELISTMEGVEEYVNKLKSEYQKRGSAPKMPVGWTAEMTAAVKGSYLDDVEFVADTVKAIYSLQTDDDEELEKWVEKLQSDYKAELKDRAQQG